MFFSPGSISRLMASWLLGNRNRTGEVNSRNPLSGAETPFLIECFAYPPALLLQIPHRHRYMFRQTPCSRCVPQTVGHQWLVNALDSSLHLSTCSQNNDSCQNDKGRTRLLALCRCATPRRPFDHRALHPAMLWLLNTARF